MEPLEMDCETKIYKCNTDFKSVKLISLLSIPMAFIFLALGIYMVFCLNSNISLSDKLSVIIGFPILCLLVPVVVSHVIKKVSMMNLILVNTQELIINGKSDRGNKTNLFEASSSHIIKWNNIVAIVQQKWIFNQTPHFIFYIGDTEKGSMPIDIENIYRIPISLKSVQNRDELENEIKSRAQNAAILFDKVLPENFVKWGLTKEDSNKFHSLINSFFKQRLIVLYIAILVGLIAFLIFLFMLMSQS